jgi:drug/metabolite transporter (DMT)-like permease
MRPLAILGVLLIVFGVIALGVQSVTFFTQERVVDAGPLSIDWQKPHTIVINPVAGIVSAVLGAVLLLANGRRTPMA